MGIPCLRDKSEKSTYYEFFQKNLQKNFKKNLEFNNQYILAKKRFTQSRIDSERIENINFTWISYLLYKLNEAKRNNILIQNWKNLLYEEVKKKYFFNQYKYQNELFFQEILINKPKDQKNKNDEHFLNEEPILSPLDLEELRTYSSRDNSFSSNKKLKNDLNFSFMSSSSNKDHNNKKFLYSLTIKLDENETKKKDLDFISKYQSYILKKYIKIIRKHIEKEDHPIHVVIDLFIKHFESYLKLIFDFCQNNEDNEKLCYDKGLEAVNEIQNFIEIMQVALKLFYSKSINFKDFTVEKDELINLISYILFNKKNFYKLILQLFSYMNAKKIEKFELKLKESESITPRKVGVNPKFCLDKETEEFWEEYKNKLKDKNENSDKNSSTEEDTLKKKEKLKNYIDTSKSELNSETEKDESDILQKKTFKSIKKQPICTLDESFINIENDNNDLDKTFDQKEHINLSRKILPKLDKIINENENEIIKDEQPYILAINYLRQIYSYKAPLEKLIIIAYVSVLMTQSVEKYWIKRKDEIPHNFLNLDADEIMSIYLYIIYKLNSPSIICHIEMMKHFTTNFTKQTILGYYYSTFEGCIKYILQDDEISLST